MVNQLSRHMAPWRHMTSSCLGAPTVLLSAVELNVTMTTGDVDFDDVPLKQVYRVVRSYPRCTGAAIISEYIHHRLTASSLQHRYPQGLFSKNRSVGTRQTGLRN